MDESYYLATIYFSYIALSRGQEDGEVVEGYLNLYYRCVDFSIAQFQEDAVASLRELMDEPMEDIVIVVMNRINVTKKEYDLNAGEIQNEEIMSGVQSGHLN